MPNARDIDASISEAVAFHLARDGVNIALVPVDVMKTARIILERRGFDPSSSAQALARRLGHRDEHTWPDNVPSLHPGPIDRMRPPTGRDSWITPIADILRHLAGEHRP